MVTNERNDQSHGVNPNRTPGLIDPGVTRKGTNSILWKGKKITDRSIRMFIKKHLPEYGSFGAADLYRDKMGITLETKVGWITPDSRGLFRVGEKLNERFCNILNLIADYCPSNIYDPAYIDMAIAHYRKKGEAGF